MRARWAGTHLYFECAASAMKCDLKPVRGRHAAGDGQSARGLDGSGQSHGGAAAGAYLSSVPVSCASRTVHQLREEE